MDIFLENRTDLTKEHTRYDNKYGTADSVSQIYELFMTVRQSAIFSIFTKERVDCKYILICLPYE